MIIQKVYFWDPLEWTSIISFFLYFKSQYLYWTFMFFLGVDFINVTHYDLTLMKLKSWMQHNSKDWPKFSSCSCSWEDTPITSTRTSKYLSNILYTNSFNNNERRTMVPGRILHHSPFKILKFLVEFYFLMLHW
jgi:hypothetical protein